MNISTPLTESGKFTFDRDDISFDAYFTDFVSTVVVGAEGEVFGAVVCLTLWSIGNGNGGGGSRRRSGFLTLGGVWLAWCCLLLGSGSRLGPSFEGFRVPFYIVR